MLSLDYLTQRLVRLKASEEWRHGGQGLLFILSKRGRGSYVSGLTTHELAPGDLLVVHGAAPNPGRLVGLEEMAFHYFAACFEHLIALFAAKEIQFLQNLTNGFKGAKLYPAASPLAQQCHGLLDEAPPQLTIEHRSHLLKIVALVLSEEFRAQGTRRGEMDRAEDHLAQVLESLTSAEILGLSVPDLARKFSCSRRHLNRLFHEHFGISVGALKMEMRLLKAVALLQDPQAKIINVAEDCGFNHLGLFNTCFKRRFGASPGQWRKQTLQIEPVHPSRAERDPSCQMRKNGLCPWSAKSTASMPALSAAMSLHQDSSALRPPNSKVSDASASQPGRVYSYGQQVNHTLRTRTAIS